MDKYTIYRNRKLGDGVYSIVYLGYDKVNKRKVAVKIIDLTGRDEKFMNSINDEIKLIEQLIKNPHKNIVKFYEIIKNIDEIIYIMELCEGNLKDFLKGSLKEQLAKYFFVQLFLGLEHLYYKEIMHRDLKPKNILLTRNNTVLKIADFGFAKKISQLQKCKSMCGSPLYMSPEILSKNPYGHESDFWSIGIILFEMLYGFNPFYKCKNINDLALMANKKRISIPPENTNLEVSDECINLLRNLLEKNNTKRISFSNLRNHEWLKEFLNNNKVIEYENSSDSDDEYLFKMD